MATSVESRGDEKAPVELSAPEGWKKTLLPQKSGTPRRKSVAFISPTGEEIKSKRQLDQYLKSHPGGPSSSEFDWSSGETPRRSRRLSEKSKETESPESEPPRKRQNKSSSEKAEDDADGEDKAAEEKDDVREETKTSQDVEMKEVADARDLKKGEESIENAVTDPNTEGKGVKGDETSAERTEDPGSDNNKTTDEKDEQVANYMRAESVDNEEEAEEQKEPEAPSELEKETANEKTISTSEEKTEGVSLPTQDLDGGKEGTAKEPADDTKEEKKPDEAKGDKEDEVPTQQLLSDADTIVNNDDLKEAEDGSRPTTNYAMHHEDKTPHEPKASQVSC